MYYVSQSLQSQVVTNPLIFLLSTMRDWLDQLTFFRGRVSVKRCRRKGARDTWKKNTYKTLASIESRVPQDIVALAPGYELTDTNGACQVCKTAIWVYRGYRHYHLEKEADTCPIN